jgi:glycosyltransferase involved in cell wall biosynthesis
MSDIILTIIVPTYNMEVYLSECLASLIVDNATIIKIEVLVINDGSTDSSSIIAHQFESNYPKSIKVIDKENGNYGSCINVGLKNANGKYVKILDADDKYDTLALQEYVHFLEKEDSDMIISDYISFSDENNILDSYIYNLHGNTLQDLLNTHHPYLQMHAVTYKTELLRKIDYHQSEGLSYTDQEWLFMPMSVVHSISYFNRTLYHYRFGRSGQTMEPSVYKKNFHQDICVVKNLISQYNSTDLNSLEEPQSLYLTNRLKERIYNIYYTYFKLFRTDYPSDILAEFDQFVKSHVPDIYILFNKYKWAEGRFLKNYLYIKNWRNNKCRPTIIIHFANYYYSFFNFIS